MIMERRRRRRKRRREERRRGTRRGRGRGSGRGTEREVVGRIEHFIGEETCCSTYWISVDS